MDNIAALVLAAGKGTRMRSDQAKVMHQLGKRPMISWPVAAAMEAGANRLVLVVGHQGETVRDYFAGSDKIEFATQEQLLGTGHAVTCAAKLLQGFDGRVLILCGDVPLIRSETLSEFLDYHKKMEADLTVLTTQLENPTGYGRIVKEYKGRIQRIAEEKDATDIERNIIEVNSGIYCADAKFLFEALAGLKNDNAQSEYYLTDIVSIATSTDRSCIAYPLNDAEELLGVNDRLQLATAERILQRRVNEALMRDGVTIVAPEATFIEQGARIGRDTVIHPNVHISGATVIGEGCIIKPGTVINSCRLGDRVHIKAGSVMTDAILGQEVTIGPMAHLRPGTELKAHVKIGNFVETKQVVIGEGSKASHLTYLGDATVGNNVNIGCGTITCNYDGVRKHRTVIENDVFVGSDVQFVAPVTIGHNSTVAAGATITRNVPPGSLAFARTPQVNKENWKPKK